MRLFYWPKSFFLDFNDNALLSNKRTIKPMAKQTDKDTGHDSHGAIDAWLNYWADSRNSAAQQQIIFTTKSKLYLFYTHFV